MLWIMSRGKRLSYVKNCVFCSRLTFVPPGVQNHPPRRCTDTHAERWKQKCCKWWKKVPFSKAPRATSERAKWNNICVLVRVKFFVLIAVVSQNSTGACFVFGESARGICGARVDFVIKTHSEQTKSLFSEAANKLRKRQYFFLSLKGQGSWL